MNNRLFIFIVGIPLTLLITIGGYFLWDVSRPIQTLETPPLEQENLPLLPPQENKNLSHEAPLWQDPTPEPTQELTPVPQKPLVEPKITIPAKNKDVVPVNNFYQNTETQVFDMNKDAIIKDEPQYKILYYTIDHSFFIFLLGGNLSMVRTMAEQELLKKLNIPETQACDLRVSVLIDKDAGVNDFGMDYKLSFCPNGKPLP